jgi:iron complex outermembrane receptor protein
MKVILSALWLLLCLNVMGQTAIKNKSAPGTIGGLITARGSGQPIEGAVITISRLDDSIFSKSLSSDESGAFTFDKLTIGTYSLSIKHVGYREFNKGQLVISTANFSISLSEIKLDIANLRLKEVVIQARQKAYTEQKIDRTIVNVSQLLSNTGVSAVEVLNNAPGVEVTDDAIVLRGKQGVTIYIDGRQTFLDGAQLLNYLKSLPSGTIERLELMPVPPAKYHVEGNAGLINIITKKNKIDGFNGSLSATHGQGRYGKSNFSLNLNYKTGGVNFFGNAGYSSNNSYFKVQRNRAFGFADQADNYSIYQDNFESSNRKSTNYKFGFDADINTSNSVGLIVDGLISPYRENGYYLLQFNHVSPDSVIKTQSDLSRNTDDVALNLYYQHKFKKERGNIRIDADYLNYNDYAYQLLNSNTYLPGNPDILDNYKLITENPFKANVYSLKSDYETQILSDIKLSAGVQSIYSKRSSNGIYFNEPGVQNDSLTNRNAYSEHINAAYISLNKELKSFTIEVGLRFENSGSNARQYNYAGTPYQPVHITYSNLFPKLYASYKLDTAAVNTLNFSFDARIDRPDYSDLNPFAFYFDRYTTFQGNASLLPERTINFDLSFTHSGTFTIGSTFSKGKNTILQYYYVTGQSLIKTSLNIRSTYDLGIYSTVNISFSKWWMANLFSELSNRMFSGSVVNSQSLYYRKLAFQVSGNNQFKLNNGWSAELSGSYRTKSTFGQGYYLPIYKVNTSLQKRIFNGKGTITLSGSDIFHSWKIKREIDVNNALITSTNFNDSQQANLTFTYRFGLEAKKRINKSGLETERGRAGVN